MGTDLVKAESFAVVQIDSDELAATIQANLGGERIEAHDLDRVKVPAGGGLSWEVPTLEGTEDVRTIEGIIIHWQNRRAYWPEQFSGGNEAPACSSDDGITGVGEPGGACDACQWAQWGSGGDGVGQACKAMRQLFVLTADSIIPIVITLPPASLQNAKQYFLRLIRANIHHTAVVTKIGLEKATSKSGGITYSKVTLAAGERLDPAGAAKVKAYADRLRPALQQVHVEREEVQS